MKFFNYWAMVIFIALISFAANAEISVFEFSNADNELRFNHLVQELRCPKCQNNNLADSNAGLALDLKTIVFEQIEDGKTDKEIVEFLKARYGDFISYRPPLKPSTWFIWFGPFVFLAVGGFAIFKIVTARQNSAQRITTTSDAIDAQAMVARWSNDVSDSPLEPSSGQTDTSEKQGPAQ